MATTADFRNGLCFNHNGEPWKIESFLHVKPGKGPAFVRTKIRNLNTGRLLENTFNSGVKIDVIRIENRKYQFLYAEGVDYHLMNNDDYEQMMMQKDSIENVQFLKEGENVEVLFHADQGMPLSAQVPSHVVLEIAHTEPGIKGNTATNTFKPAKTETGADIQVPLFIHGLGLGPRRIFVWVDPDINDSRFSCALDFLSRAQQCRRNSRGLCHLFPVTPQHFSKL